MPTVPRIGNRVQSQGSPGVRVNTQTPQGTFGGDTKVNKEVNKISDTLQGIVLDERKKADEAIVKGKFADLTTWRNAYVANAKTLKGENAQTLPEDMNKAFTEINNEIKQGLNARQIASYDNLAQSVYLDTDAQIQSHVAVEQFNLTNKNNQAVIQNEKNYAIDNFTDPLVIGKSKSTIVATIDTLGKSQGWSDELVAAKKHDELSSMHIGVIQNLVTVDSDAAETYFDANKAEINQTNMNKYKLDKNIKAYQKHNSEGLQDSIFDKISQKKYVEAMDEVNAANKPIEQGGIGSQRAIALKKSIEKSQEDGITEILDKELNSDYSGFVEMVDKIAGNDKDRFAVKQFIVDKYDKNYYKDEAKTDIENAFDIIRDVREENKRWTWDIRNGINYVKENLPYLNFPLFSGVPEDEKTKIKLGKINDESLASGLSKLINYAARGNKDPEALMKVADEIIREEQIRRNPKEAKYIIGEEYTNQSGRKAKAIRQVNGSIALEYID